MRYLVVAILSLILAGCAQNLTSLRTDAVQPAIVLTAEQMTLCEVNNTVIGLTEENARQVAVQLAVDGANCRDRVDSVLASINGYNESIMDNEIFNTTLPIMVEPCGFTTVEAGNSPNRVAALVDTLAEEANECARRHSQLIASVATFNQTL